MKKNNVTKQWPTTLASPFPTPSLAMPQSISQIFPTPFNSFLSPHFLLNPFPNLPNFFPSHFLLNLLSNLCFQPPPPLLPQSYPCPPPS